MQESYVEGPTSHGGPESCASGRKAVGEALTGVLAGRPLSRVIRTPWPQLRVDRGAEAVKICRRPVAPIAGQARGVKAKHGANLTGTQPGHKPIEAGSGRHAACRSAKVIIDDFDLRKSTTAGLLNQVVLPTLALQIGLYLRLGGLPHIDDGLAAQHGRGQ